MKEPTLAEVVQDLKDAGWTQELIAAAVGCTQSSISRISNGTEPSYSVGRLLLDLWRNETVPPRAAAK